MNDQMVETIMMMAVNGWYAIHPQGREVGLSLSAALERYSH